VAMQTEGLPRLESLAYAETADVALEVEIDADVVVVAVAVGVAFAVMMAGS